MSTILYYNAKIYTVNASFDLADALIIESGKIIFVGTLAEIPTIEIKERIDCKNAYIYPGFIDPHCHFIDLGKSYFTAPLYETRSFEEVLERCATFQQTNNSLWLLGRGWNQNDWTNKELPNKKILDQLFPDIPVLLIRIDSHVGLLNQKAIELTQVIQAHFIEEKQVELKEGIATGIIYDKALYHVLEFVKPDAATKSLYIQKATDICLSHGLTSVGDAFMTYEDFEVYKQLNELNQLRIQVYGMMVPSKENKAYLVAHGVYKNQLLHINATKHFADGALGSRGAALIEPYSDAPDNTGMLLETDAYWIEEAQFCIDHQLQMITHAIGDAANKRIIQLYKKFLSKQSTNRWRIEHMQMLDEEDIQDIKEYQIVPSIQSTHGTSDYTWAINRIGPARMKKSYRVKDLLDACGYIVNGSDFPIEKANPLRGFYASITRQSDEGLPEGGFDPSQKISREAALKSMTIWAAYAQFEEAEKGSLEVGKNADFVMLDTDLMNCDEGQILKSKVLMTIVKGENKYGAII
ncbi:MAG: amidohydrolase [Bacteroidota bacterium]